MKVIEKTGKVTREYTIVGPQYKTVDSFWKYLLLMGIITGYEIKEV
jgi:hypothetical protein